MNAIDDCWNRIGIGGDRTCPDLRPHVHCRNCPQYSAAAKRVLDAQISPEQIEISSKRIAEPLAPKKLTTRSVLLLRCGLEWLGIDPRICGEVVSIRTIRTLPHRRNAAALGLANVRGELLVCVSLAALLGIPTTADSSMVRLLVIRGGGATTALRVEEIHGIHRFGPEALQSVPDMLGGSARSTMATLVWNGRTVGLLATDRLLANVDRCIA
ncbi:MAG TPA: chemotaxis protein CheW [Gammaproteobacteria bacterium]|nr:chemotaxis protein CheW [Gammaproteobacteria bacterium]